MKGRDQLIVSKTFERHAVYRLVSCDSGQTDNERASCFDERTMFPAGLAICMHASLCPRVKAGEIQ